MGRVCGEKKGDGPTLPLPRIELRARTPLLPSLRTPTTQAKSITIMTTRGRLLQV